MSRRRILVLAGVASVTALGLACYLPELFSPVPGLVLDLKSCLEPRDETPHGAEAASDPPQRILTKLLYVGFNVSRAGTSLLPDEENERKGVCGVVKDEERLRNVLERLRAEGSLRLSSDFQIETLSGQAAYMMSGGEIPVLSTVDGVSVISHKPYGIIVEVLPKVGKNGLIHLQMNETVSELKAPAAGPGPPEFDIMKARISIELRDGQTCFIGGLKRKSKWMTETRVPLASDLPGIGTSFVFRHEALVDEELLILATPTLARSQ
jgi:type II secretory pathway component GspD/PulD (secretin)